MPNYTGADGETVKNRLGATSHEQLEQREAEYVALRLWQIDQGKGPAGAFDGDHLKALHRHLFQDVYEWAGHTRDERVPLADGTTATEPLLRKSGGALFMLGPSIGPALDGFAAQLREADYLRGLPRAAFTDRAADTMADLNAIHPFREGNGRTQRVFMSQLADQAGHPLEFAVISKARMVDASIAANEQGDLGPMRRVFLDASDPERVAALRGMIDYLKEQKFGWNEVYIATAAPGHAVELTMGGRAEHSFFGRTETGIIVGRTADLPDPPPQRDERFTLTPRPEQIPAREQAELDRLAALWRERGGLDDGRDDREPENDLGR